MQFYISLLVLHNCKNIPREIFKTKVRISISIMITSVTSDPTFLAQRSGRRTTRDCREFKTKCNLARTRFERLPVFVNFETYVLRNRTTINFLFVRLEDIFNFNLIARNLLVYNVASKVYVIRQKYRPKPILAVMQCPL